MQGQYPSRTRALLNQFDLAEYVHGARANGRLRLAGSGVRRHAAELYKHISQFHTVEGEAFGGLDQLVEFASKVLFGEWYLWYHTIPRYRSYTNIDVIDWFLGDARPDRCRTAIRVFLEDFIASEERALAAGDRRITASFDAERVQKRVDRLRVLLSNFGTSGSVVAHTPSPPSWEAFIDEPELALVHLTAFPQTLEHDEYAFLRTVHIAEVCFAAVLACGRAAIAGLERGDVGEAAQHVADAVPFAGVLTPLLQNLKTTMRPEHFARFRDATGDAGAVQSRNYQLMQITMFGADPATMRVMAGVDEVQDLTRHDDRAAPSLARLAREPMASGSAEGRELAAQVAALDKELLKWRTLHKGIGRTHLPAEAQATGGTSGVSYLKRTMNRTLTPASQPEEAAA